MPSSDPTSTRVRSPHLSPDPQAATFDRRTPQTHFSSTTSPNRPHSTSRHNSRDPSPAPSHHSHHSGYGGRKGFNATPDSRPVSPDLRSRSRGNSRASRPHSPTNVSSHPRSQSYGGGDGGRKGYNASRDTSPTHFSRERAISGTDGGRKGYNSSPHAGDGGRKGYNASRDVSPARPMISEPHHRPHSRSHSHNRSREVSPAPAHTHAHSHSGDSGRKGFNATHNSREASPARIHRTPTISEPHHRHRSQSRPHSQTHSRTHSRTQSREASPNPSHAHNGDTGRKGYNAIPSHETHSSSSSPRRSPSPHARTHEGVSSGRKGYNASHLSPKPSPHPSPKLDSSDDISAIESGVSGLGLNVQEREGPAIVNGSYTVGGKEGACGGGRKGYNRTPSPRN